MWRKISLEGSKYTDSHSHCCLRINSFKLQTELTNKWNPIFLVTVWLGESREKPGCNLTFMCCSQKLTIFTSIKWNVWRVWSLHVLLVTVWVLQLPSAVLKPTFLTLKFFHFFVYSLTPIKIVSVMSGYALVLHYASALGLCKSYISWEVRLRCRIWPGFTFTLFSYRLL